jgi:hypothetical protein
MRIAVACCLAAAVGCATPQPSALQNHAAEAPRAPPAPSAPPPGDRPLAFERVRCPGDDCFSYVIGSARCPFIHRFGMLRVRRLPATEGPLVGEFCCWLDNLETATRGGRRYLRVSSERYRDALDCTGGPAKARLAATYRVDGDRLVLEADDSVVWR